METVSGCVEHIVFRNEDNGYTVFYLSCQEYDEITCVGNVPFISEGEFFDVSGDFIEHPTYGHQLKVIEIKNKRPEDTESIERYLSSGAVKGIGPKLAALIVERFGEDTFRIIEEEPEELASVKGISLKKAMSISIQVDEKREMRSAMMFLQEYGISNRLSAKIYERYGSGLYEIIKSNPYRLAEDIDGIGFKIADEIAMRSGMDMNSDFRIRCGIIYCLQQAASEGHIYLPENELLKKMTEVLGIDRDSGDKFITDLAMERKLILDRCSDEPLEKNESSKMTLNGYENQESIAHDENAHKRNVYLAIYFHTELAVARQLHDLNVSYGEDNVSVKKIKKIEQEENITLDDMQRIAVTESIRNGLMVITGGPGTGKTTTIKTIIRYFKNEGKNVVLAAPTGRAARRMTEATGENAQTIHRLLEVTSLFAAESGNHTMDSGRTNAGRMYEKGVFFERNSENPLEADIIIIDEMSMVDIFLMHSLLDAVVPGTRLILVGDMNQLPSVGPGSVLKDIIASHEFNIVKLNKIFRQAAMSDIIVNAHRINDGEDIDLSNNSRDFFFLKRNDINMIISNIITLIKEKLPGYVDAPMSEIQVLTPMRKGPLGVERLNRILQEYLNPPSPNKTEYVSGDTTYRAGDKVMQIKNDYQLEWEIKGISNITVVHGLGVFNGDTGIISQINKFDETLTVVFDENREVVYSFGDLDELELAYAVTVHKSQGSEYPAVILPLLNGPRLLFNRNLLYTAVTRAQKCVTILGSDETVRDMINNISETKRFTSLDLRIKEMKG